MRNHYSYCLFNEKECWIGLHDGFREAPISLIMAESLLARTFAKGEPTGSEAVATATGCNILSLGWRDKVTGRVGGVYGMAMMTPVESLQEVGAIKDYKS
ncbi:hypothetical protein PHYBLDRAFT_138916 [Phycomyces blakesleeanus NRRL 1555(-)]|uniref:Uncharacterized protein n=1 Tax=Phycomyces blakesleeanus (strain ATCC 8743b / DSM 1359 / FGSC 10004 / NBRC 33097 / NRRL 1555) TaxID=763407 RepID=A0A163ESW9_PHYB8|nr:hypothetical protein PHYBLDRAFT_138916 [Phycomyces blakesleeanus NRRL 1555(-)]OAD81370.1 hypothetical protein PHYBLDRAFT_138916 [Phycomyces blakesleeanus NRRL 1555(-)]|eukprot:XP_018299410.1 hypothetical protein PHYBLDRAFT_138916 [Phycomyces blakesleeanus NRRL 1555(-)]